MIDEMLAAITANIEYLKKNGNSQMRIKEGRFINVIDDNYLYEFKLDYLQDIDTDIDIEVRLFSKSYTGKVAAVNGQIIQIAVDQHIGDSIPSATLVISSYFLMEKLHEKLTGIQGSSTSNSMIEKTFGLIDSVISEDESFQANPDRGLNPFQEKAIRTVLGSEVTYIWGPPGTGKSMTIAALLEELVNRGKTVLLIAHTNAATDSVLEKVVKVMRGNPVYEDGKIIRIGSTKSISKAIQGTKVMPEVVVEEKARPLREEIVRLTEERGEIGKRLEDFVQIENAEKNIYEAKKRIGEIEKSSVKNENEVKLLKGEVHSGEQLIVGINQLINEHQAKGTFSKLFSGTSVDKLTAQKSQALQSLTVSQKRLDFLLAAQPPLKSEYSSAKMVLEKNQDFISTFPFKYSSDESKKLHKKLENIAEQIASLEKQIDELQEVLIREAKGLVATLTKSYMYAPILERKFDCIILDEASMAPLPAIASVAENSGGKFALVGDFLQLPPIAQHNVDPTNKSEEEANREQKLVDDWLKRDIFDAVHIAEDVNNGNDSRKPWMVQLKVQYRMHPDISDLINRLVYSKDGSTKYTLDNGDNTYHNGEATLNNKPLAGFHVGIYNTSSIGTLPIKSDSGSTYNLTHALIAVRIAKEAIDNGVESVGIISSYRAQINLIGKIIEDDESKYRGKIIADTVHKFQGGDRDLIIFDVTTPRSNTMYDDLKDGGDDAKLINVALSRAKDKCILLVDVEAVLKKHSQSSLIRKSIEIVHEKNYPIIDAKGILEHYHADDRTELWLEKLYNVKDIAAEVSQSQLFDEYDFYSYFQKDLLDATQEVIIQSAFLTLSRINHLMPIFKHILAKGVRIFVITRLAREQSGNMIEQSREGLRLLESNGIIVLPLSGMIHQKFGIIDRKLMWEGSLNILSQRDSSETMRRIDGIATVSQFLDFHKLDKNLGPIGANNLKHCEVCKEPGAWYWSKKTRFGIWTYCLVGGHSPGKPPKTDTERNEYQQKKKASVSDAAEIRKKVKLNSSGQPVCPVHNRVLQKKTGRFGEYWECALVKECGCRANQKQLAHLF